MEQPIIKSSTMPSAEETWVIKKSNNSYCNLFHVKQHKMFKKFNTIGLNKVNNTNKLFWTESENHCSTWNAATFRYQEIIRTLFIAIFIPRGTNRIGIINQDNLPMYTDRSGSVKKIQFILADVKSKKKTSAIVKHIKTICSTWK